MNYDEINIVGISQGGLISRSVVERCEGIPKVHTLFTFGGPHGGISAYKKCENLFCVAANRVLAYLADVVLVQHFCAPADYYRPWWNMDRFYN
mmetsp:Transcript_17588/g.24240  ORF Transcript_17588/g.24240 Transcript_17588/m.24240 type:complete len:93 (+) Transcript_17588:293-571(+)